MKLIFLDTETTGNDVIKDRLCQICYKTEEGIRTEYFKPPIPISVKAMSITHITNKMVAHSQVFSDSQMKKDLEALLVEDVLVAHNAKFDASMLIAEGVNVPNIICTLKVARFLDQDGKIPEYNLQYLRYYLGLEIEGNAHDAEGDVQVLHAVFERLFSKIKESGLDEKSAILKMIEISNTPTLYKQFNFGKHINEKIEDVARTDKGYLEWLLKQKLETNDDEDWIYTLKQYVQV